MALKPLLLAPLLLSAFALAGCSDSGTDGDGHGEDTHGESHDVAIHGSAFSPKAISIPVGHNIMWTNHDTVVHTIDGGAFPDSGDLAKGKTFSHHFDTVGTFSYKCGKHASMTGTITVT